MQTKTKPTKTKITKTKPPEIPFELIDKHEAARILGVSTDTLKVDRRQGLLHKGLHYFVWNSRTTRYNKFLIEDWARNRGNPKHHQLAIDQYEASLPNGQQIEAGRSAKTPVVVA